MTKPSGFWLDAENLSDLAVATLLDLIDMAKQAHTADVVLRLNGRDVRRQADWIKYLRGTTMSGKPDDTPGRGPPGPDEDDDTPGRGPPATPPGQADKPPKPPSAIRRNDAGGISVQPDDQPVVNPLDKP